MARKLAKHVHLEAPGHGQHVFAAGEVPPDWAAKLITNPKAWADDESPADPDADAQPSDEDDETSVDHGEVKRPGKSGPGSGREAWAAYAQSRGIEVDEQMSRDDIIAAVGD